MQRKNTRLDFSGQEIYVGDGFRQEGLEGVHLNEGFFSQGLQSATRS